MTVGDLCKPENERAPPRTVKMLPRRPQGGLDGTEEAPRGAFGRILESKIFQILDFFRKLADKVKIYVNQCCTWVKPQILEVQRLQKVVDLVNSIVLLNIFTNYLYFLLSSFFLF